MSNFLSEQERLKAEKQDFFVNASHELNTPLSSIIGYTEIIKAEKKYIPEFIDTILNQAQRMKELLSDMMGLAALDAGKGFEDGPCELHVVAAEVIATFMPKAEGKNITLTTDFDSVEIVADRGKITELLGNLIDNAIKYTDRGGEVFTTIKKLDGGVKISVKDNGQGIAQAHIPRIFERFYRTDKGRARAEGGTGLGLAIVKHICNHYNAPIEVKSKEGVGTEIIITLKI